MQGFYRSLERLASKTGARTVHEVGCGEGYLARRLSGLGYAVQGSDRSEDVIKLAKGLTGPLSGEIDFFPCSIEQLSPSRHAANLVVCCEVLEHVPDPGKVVDCVSELASPHAIFSVPREPLWRFLNLCSGRYWKSFGDTPGHVNHFGVQSFCRLLSPRFVIEELVCPLPWIMALCRVSSRAPYGRGRSGLSV